VYVPFLDGDYAERWFGFPHALWLVPFPLLGVVVSYFLYRSVAERREYWPFLLSLGMFAVGYGGLAASFWPHIIPPHLTIWNAASPPETQSFLIVGLVILLPFILFYTAWSYWIFRGKVGRDMGYH
jgi:cytochrome d ubiquinol oxidase subunit II